MILIWIYHLVSVVLNKRIRYVKGVFCLKTLHIEVAQSIKAKIRIVLQFNV